MSVIKMPAITPQSTTWTYRSNSASFVSATSGTMQTVARPGGRWSVSLKYPTLTGTNRKNMQSFLAAVDGQANRFYLYDHSYSIGGSATAPELMTNGDFSNGVTGWTSTNASDVAITASSGGMRATNLTVTARTIYSSAITVENAKPYAVVYHFTQDKVTVATTRVGVGTTTTGQELLETTHANGVDGRFVKTFTASGTTAYVNFYSFGGASSPLQNFPDEFYTVHSVSVSRCLLVNGASQTGSSLNIDGAEASTNALLKPGDMVEIGNRVHMVTADLDTNASGEGLLQFKPALSTSPSDNDPVLLYRPSIKAVLSSRDAGWSTRPGTLSDFSFEAMEIIE